VRNPSDPEADTWPELGLENCVTTARYTRSSAEPIPSGCNPRCPWNCLLGGENTTRPPKNAKYLWSNDQRPFRLSVRARSDPPETGYPHRRHAPVMTKRASSKWPRICEVRRSGEAADPRVATYIRCKRNKLPHVALRFAHGAGFPEWRPFRRCRAKRAFSTSYPQFGRLDFAPGPATLTGPPHGRRS
jgi:hypothetical protein